MHMHMLMPMLMLMSMLNHLIMPCMLTHSRR